MPNSCVRVWVHLVWATWDREPMIRAEWEAGLYAGIAAACREMKATPIEIGGTVDHVHLLLSLPAALRIADAAHDMKGASSHLVNHVLAPGAGFRWQGAYGAFSVSMESVEAVRAYIRNQKQRHADHDLNPEWERCTE